MMMSAPAPDWIAEVMRDCRSLALTVSSLSVMPVAFLHFWPQVARPATNRVGAQQREASAPVCFPQLQFRLFLEDPNEDRRFPCHVLGVEIGKDFLGEWLQVTAADIGGLVVATKERRGGHNRRGGKKQAQ
jgi:hypothetical protein